MATTAQHDPQLDARRRWAREQLGIPLDADDARTEAALLAKLEEAEFVPSDSVRQAMLALAAKRMDAAQSPPRAGYDAFQESLETQLRKEIEQFAREFFALPPEERRSRWTGLMSRPGLSPPLELRLAALSTGLRVVPNQSPPKQADVSELAAVAAELFVLRPQARAELRRRKMGTYTTDIRRWTTAAKTLSRWYADVAALDPQLVDELANWKKRQKQLAAAAAWRGQASTPTQTRFPVWVAMLVLFIVVNGVRSSCNSEQKPSRPSNYKLPDFKIPEFKMPQFPPPTLPRTGSDNDPEMRWGRLLTKPDEELDESERSLLILLKLEKIREEVQKKLREEQKRRSGTLRGPIEAKPPGGNSSVPGASSLPDSDSHTPPR